MPVKLPATICNVGGEIAAAFCMHAMQRVLLRQLVGRQNAVCCKGLAIQGVRTSSTDTSGPHA